MKVVHSNKDKKPFKELVADARQFESEGLLAEAATAWWKVVRSNPLYDKSYDRLMVIYRKQKETEKELEILEKAISTFHAQFRNSQPEFDKKVVSLSKALLKSTGLVDKKGKHVYDPGEVARWEKRKGGLLKRMKKKK